MKWHQGVKISLSTYPSHGWEWIYNHRMYRTNGSGDGLWELQQAHDKWWADGSPVMEYKQVEGTCQFSLVGCNYNQAYHRIARYFAKLQSDF